MNRMTSTPLATALLTAAALVAIAGPATAMEVRGTPVDLRDTVAAEIDAADDLDTYVFDALGGTSLSLTVTPQITPDDRILLNLRINQDSVGDLVPSGTGGAIPTIDTTELNTQVLVGNGETVVLGGVFRTEDVESVSKVPFFGDIPYLGYLFKSTNIQSTKTETLIFITPRILAESMLD